MNPSPSKRMKYGTAPTSPPSSPGGSTCTSLRGYVQHIHQQKTSLSTSNPYFDIDLQTNENETTTVRVMISTDTASIRQILQSKCNTGSPILLSNLRKAQSGTAFMNRSTIIRDVPPASIQFPFKPISNSSVTPIKIILEQHTSGVFTVSGLVSWIAEENIVKTDQTKQEKRVRDAQITDTTGTISISIWENHINDIQVDQFYTLSNCKLKFFYGKKLATTSNTQITPAEKQVLPPSQSTPIPHNIITSPEILNVGVNIYPVCNNKDCRKKVSANPGTELLTCHGCNRAMFVKNCYVEINASFQLEKDNKITNATAFAKVLSSYLGEDVYEYKNNVEVLTEKLLKIENANFHLSNTGKLITKICPNTTDDQLKANSASASTPIDGAGDDLLKANNSSVSTPSDDPTDDQPQANNPPATSPADDPFDDDSMEALSQDLFPDAELNV